MTIARSGVAILVGGIADIVVTNVLEIPIILFLVVPKMTSGTTAAAMQDVLQKDPALHWGIFALGALGSICGGYISAWIAKRHEVLHGTLAAWLCVALGIFALTSEQAAAEPGLGMLGIPLSLAMCGFGGWLRKRQTVAKA